MKRFLGNVGIVGLFLLFVHAYLIFGVAGNYRVGRWEQAANDPKQDGCNRKYAYDKCAGDAGTGTANLTPNGPFFVLPPGNLNVEQHITDPRISANDQSTGDGTLWWVTRLSINWKNKSGVYRTDEASLHLVKWIALQFDVALNNCSCYFD